MAQAEVGDDVFGAALSARGVRCVSFGPQLVRFVTHKDVNRRDIEYTLKIAQEVLC